jgi:hypothetical protein
VRLGRHRFARLGLVAAVLLLAGCIRTTRVMLAEPLPAVPASVVQVFTSPPAQPYRELARIETESGIGFGTQGQTDAAIARLRAKAAEVGADGVILIGLDTVRAPVSVGIGGASYGRHVGVSGGVGLPTAQRRAAGIAIRLAPP